MHERMDTHPTPKEFGFEIPRVDRHHGHVFILYGGREYKWFLEKTISAGGKAIPGRIMLLNSDENELTEELRSAMKNQVRAILGPEIRTPAP